jgi:hypothetical protein
MIKQYVVTFNTMKYCDFFNEEVETIFEVVGVFSTREKAENYINGMHQSKSAFYRIEKVILDSPEE